MRLPEAYTAAMKELLGSEYEAYLSCFEEPKVQGLRVNTAKISVEDFLKITPFSLTPVPWTENGFYYNGEEPVTKHPHYYAGLYYIQEPSAMIPASRLPIEAGDRVLDLCAAPGGKATELAARLSGTGLIVANDISNSRAKGLLKNLELFGAGNMLVTSETPEKLRDYFEGYFDKILIDAPCSGEGMFRRDPAMIKNWEEHGPSYYAALQQDIVRSAVKLLRPGGMLLYSTCTFSETENEGTVRALLDACPELSLLPIEGFEGFSSGSLPHCIRVFPHKVRGEGHFAALLKKNAPGGIMPGLEGQTPEKAGMAGDERMRGKINQAVEGRIPEQWAVSAGRKKNRKKAAGGGREERHTCEGVSGHLPEELLAFLEGLPRFLEQAERIEIRENRAYLMPEGLPPIRGLRFLRTGLYLGECRKNRFEPSQALAMHLRMEDFPWTVSLPPSDSRVMRYLKGESVELTEEEAPVKKGWILVGTDGYPLGWAKASGGMLKNKYYPGWRVQ